MNNPDSKSKPMPGGGEQDSPDSRFRYIGFDVYPKHVPEFWKSDQEAMEYSKRVGAETGTSSLNREFSLLHVVPVSKVDRVIVTLVSVVMLATLAMPWVHYRMATGADQSLSWFGAFGALLGGLGDAFGGGLATGVSAILGLAIMVLTPLLGLWTLAMLWKKDVATDAYLIGLRRPLKIGMWLFLAGVAVVVLSLVGGHIPGYESWGLIEPGEKYDIKTLMTILSFGAYSSLAMSLVAGVKAGDL